MEKPTVTELRAELRIMSRVAVAADRVLDAPDHPDGGATAFADLEKALRQLRRHRRAAAGRQTRVGASRSTP